MAEQTAEKTDNLEGTTILTQKTQEPPNKETTLFQGEADKGNAVQAAKEAAAKELADKLAAEKTAAEKMAADKTAADAADAAKKAEADKLKAAAGTTVPLKKGDAPKTDYTLNLPENSVLTQEDLAAMAKDAKEAGLSEEEAKELIKTNDQLAKTAQTRLLNQQTEQIKSLRVEWKESVKKDPDMGGEHLAETAIKASRAFKAVASPAMQKFCEESGYADHPEMVRMMLKVYDLIGEDKFIKGTTSARPSGQMTTEDKAKKLFGNPIKEAVVQPR